MELKRRSNILESGYDGEAPNSEPLANVAAATLKVLHSAGIRSVICGGCAVAHYGYLRSTGDVDFIVSNKKLAKATLLHNGFTHDHNEAQKVWMNGESRASVDLIQAGEKLNYDSYVKMPMPKSASLKPEYISLSDLISLKIDSGRFRDMSDVTELIQRNKLPLDFKIANFPDLKRTYEDTWKFLHQPPEDKKQKFESMFRLVRRVG